MADGISLWSDFNGRPGGDRPPVQGTHAGRAGFRSATLTRTDIPYLKITDTLLPQPEDVHQDNKGYDISSRAPISGEPRLIEVKGLAVETGSILLTPDERRVAEDRADCYYLYILTNCAAQPQLQEPVKDPARFPWHEVSKV